MHREIALEHGCRCEYGPLELRLQSTPSSSDFTIYVEDPRLEHRTVDERAVQSTLESAKEAAVLHAREYLRMHQEEDDYAATWRCS
jgi:hypothetical protein